MADNTTEYATKHGIELYDNAVAVTIRLVDETVVPEQHIKKMETRFGSHINAVVSINNLVPLAEDNSTQLVSLQHQANKTNNT